MATKRKDIISAVREVKETEAPSVEVKLIKDRVGNVRDKEVALADAGVTRLGVYSVIREGLEATREQVSYDEDGVKVIEIVPDFDKRNKAAELALKAFGDLKEQAIVGNVTNHNKVIYSWRTT